MVGTWYREWENEGDVERGDGWEKFARCVKEEDLSSSLEDLRDEFEISDGQRD